MRARQDRPAWIRLCVVAVTLLQLLCLGGVLPALHFAFVAHRVCAEHGALVEASSAEEPAARAGAPAREVSLVGAADSEQHGHDHCGVAIQGVSAEVPAPRRDLAAVLPSSRPAGPPAHARTAHVEIALLLYAPKLAPPA